MDATHKIKCLEARAKENRISMAKVCARAGIAPSTVNRIKNGKTSPRVDTLTALDGALKALIAERLPTQDAGRSA